jgi:two-component system, NarL family, sensor histidine kinase UhpB
VDDPAGSQHQGSTAAKDASREAHLRSEGDHVCLQAQMLAQVDDAVVATDLDERIIYWGRGAEALYGVAAADALGKPITDMYHRRGEDVHVLLSGVEIQVESTVSMVRDTEGRQRGYMAIIRDVGERKRIAQANALTAARLGVALALVEMAVFSQDRDLRYDWVWRPQLVEPHDVLGKTDYDMVRLLGEPGIADVIAVKRRVIETGAATRTEVRIAQSWYDLAVEPILDEAGAVVGITGASVDITSRKQGEEQLRESREQLRALTAKLQSIREEEKTRIARDLHDELGQPLTALTMQLQAITSRIETIGPVPEVQPLLDPVVAASKLAAETVTRVQRIALELRPSPLDVVGLALALEAEAQQFQARSGVACEVRLPRSLPALSPDVATALYRIAQEALTNVIRHADAKHVLLRVEVAPDRITLQVEDDGRGFDPAVVRSPAALGLLGMTERARSLGGDVTFGPGATRGTVVSVSIPLAFGGGR